MITRDDQHQVAMVTTDLPPKALETGFGLEDRREDLIDYDE
jgi:hypothetical protein